MVFLCDCRWHVMSMTEYCFSHFDDICPLPTYLIKRWAGLNRYCWNIERFRNYPRFRNYDWETTIQKLFRPIQKLGFRNYFPPIQKLCSNDSDTIFDRFRNYLRPIRKLFSTESATTIQGGVGMITFTKLGHTVDATPLDLGWGGVV